MDETGNKESDRFFVIGFLYVNDSEGFISSISRVRDQIEAMARYNRIDRIKKLKQLEDIEQIYGFAKTPSSFELKFKKVNQENIRLFKILLKILIYKTDFRFDALVIDRRDEHYAHKSLADMYKIITHLYFNYRMKEEVIFVPDSFDPNWNWSSILNNNQIKAIIPGSSHSLLPLQVVDLLTGLIGQALKDEKEYSNKDLVRAPLIKVFEEELNLNISRNVTIQSPKYISVWTIDFSKTKKRSS
jgi:hypothetical protein